MLHILQNIINLIFPPKCIFCARILDASTKINICGRCFAKIPFLEKNYVYYEARNNNERYFDTVVCVCEYTGIIKRAVIKFKFFNKASYYRAFSKLLAQKLKKMTNNHKFDIIVSVPLHKSRERDRGYNQAFLISRALSREIGIPECSGALKRIKNTATQSLLKKNDRLLNTRDAFVVSSNNKVYKKSILLVDDIFTTGSTVNECSRVLKEAGAAYVCVAVIASARK
ncbi:ComF family protein [Anaerobacterium chartisolvens]|uniref:ComF family protein n=1 Tax=Anaerobacterium chartisolvens TaxID=1297424 RepID=UPI001FA84A36|nr:ComF family protein [Anaerobacterium chartisolvens]